jgi:hypothetical protein
MDIGARNCGYLDFAICVLIIQHLLRVVAKFHPLEDRQSLRASEVGPADDADQLGPGGLFQGMASNERENIRNTNAVRFGDIRRDLGHPT